MFNCSEMEKGEFYYKHLPFVSGRVTGYGIRDNRLQFLRIKGKKHKLSGSHGFVTRLSRTVLYTYVDVGVGLIINMKI